MNADFADRKKRSVNRVNPRLITSPSLRLCGKSYVFKKTPQKLQDGFARVQVSTAPCDWCKHCWDYSLARILKQERASSNTGM